MVTKNIVLLFLIVAIVLGCATTHSSLGKRTSKGIELIAASESEVLSAAFEAISQKFPAAYIQKLSDYQTGFSWFHKPFLDKTTFKFKLLEGKGFTVDGVEVVGFSYSIDTIGSQFAVNARYVQPLIKEFKAILSKRSIGKVYVENVTYQRSYEQKLKLGKSGQADSKQHVVEATKEKFAVSQHWAVIVGVSEYHDSRIPALRYASNDARSFYEWIISPSGGRYSPSRVRALIDKDATGSNIKYALFDWLGQALDRNVNRKMTLCDNPILTPL